MIKHIILVSLSLILNSCGTLIDATESRNPPRIYGGVRADATAVKYSICRGPGYERIFFLIDMPLSFVVDTFLLPIAVPAYFIGNDEEENH